MIIDGVPISHMLRNGSLSERAVGSFLTFIEKRLHVLILTPALEYANEMDLQELLQLAALLKKEGVIQRTGRIPQFSDEPQAKLWYAICNNDTSHNVGGLSWESEADAARAALAEALERYIWLTQDDYYRQPILSTENDIQKKGLHISPSSFVSFSDKERAEDQRKRLPSDARYLWVKGFSLITENDVFLPAQVVNGMPSRTSLQDTKEPIIRHKTSVGLATWPTQSGARLAGINELLEREAYMIMWLNQLTLPRVFLTSLFTEHPSLEKCVALCERYYLKVHVIKLPTDAPTHAIAVVLEDLSDFAPRFTVGLNAHRSLPVAIQKAMGEALRSRRRTRIWLDEGTEWDEKTPVLSVGHDERLYYWSVPRHAQKLEFLIRGPEIRVENAPWDMETENEHLIRILAWCKTKCFECVAVSLGTSKSNPTSLFVERMVMPDLQPTYLTEATRMFGGSRWKDVPTALGYTALSTPFSETPHPFS